ncbi:hypothetical protein BOW53_15115 [Solemya pervernicosa gill symbiont]|uniref:Calcineurin-like phosphoesterase domain-containing protein n=2 Tax=Gammaproteobacteria incertae sedis TaxID=118884 RepID=A0A1T2L0D1_9GAMM|nr:phosphodiesterase [Candidatus Reidiella endopervernicosa]OOZ38555.1 hypothetical protein BOW53_15115 [Solemya pervernicosa gill symbiont]QKQ27655.1 phosphodiesterase [Candidatus Reidiella endopervernicosa]
MTERDLANASPLKLIQISDTHLYADTDAELYGIAIESRFQAVLEKVATEEADLLVVSGDLANGDTDAAYQRLKHSLQELNLDTALIPGNHDTPERVASISAGRLSNQMVWQLDGWQILMLDSSNTNSQSGRLGSKQLAELESQLRAHPNQPTLIFLHHQAVAIGCRWLDTMLLEDRDTLFDQLDRNPQVSAVVWGHTHQAFEAEYHGIKLYGTPSTNAQFKVNSDEFAIDESVDTGRPGYRRLLLHADGTIESCVIRVDV